MAVSTTLNFTSIDNLYLDPQNPRLGRHNIGENLSQEDLLEIMRTWTLEELALSYLESGGFWTHEALIVVKEPLYDNPDNHLLVVVEGNRRLAALIYLQRAFAGNPVSKRWEHLTENAPVPPENLFSHVPYLVADSREDVQAFLGFRHVTGIKQWGADEKAAFIADLIDRYGLTYDQVMRKIGSKTPTVRQNYIAYRLLLQIDDSVEDVPTQEVEKRFAILYMSLRTEGVRNYLQIDIMAEPDRAARPVPDSHIKNLQNFARWLFGTEEAPPIVTDTRQISKFGQILKSTEALEYLERTLNPKLEIAERIAGEDEEEIITLINQAADNLEIALSKVHFYRSSTKMQHAVHRLGIDSLQLLSIFPKIFNDLQQEMK